jgi:hypothetical protein
MTKELVYPYHASKEREATIRDNWERIRESMTQDEVVGILGEPDERSRLYEPKVWGPKEIGSTYWYVIQRMQKNGSVIEKDEKLVRVAFDLKGSVIGIVQWGL